MSSLDTQSLRSELLAPHGQYAAIDVVASTGSTNADLHASARAGGADRSVLIADEQTAGAGRLSREWVSPPGTGLYLSVLLRPAGVAAEGLASLTIAAGLALIDLTARLGVDATLKWPNDLLVGGKKAAGILAELVPGAGDGRAVVLGIGLNVLPMPDIPPGPGGLAATSLAEQGASTTDRTEVAVALLRAFAERERRWRDAAGDLAAAGLLADYRAHCSTIGADIRLTLPDGTDDETGRAVDIDPTGQLIIETAAGQRRTVFAGDVVHLRMDS